MTGVRFVSSYLDDPRSPEGWVVQVRNHRGKEAGTGGGGGGEGGGGVA